VTDPLEKMMIVSMRKI